MMSIDDTARWLNWQRLTATPGVRAVARLGPTRIARIVAATFIGTMLVFVVLFYPDIARPTLIGSDVSNYFAAGQRLNDGHDLYGLQPGDREVPLRPPYWSVPILSPPPIAVLWRPLALLPGDVSMWAWWLAALVASGVTLTWLVASGSPKRNLLIAVLSPALALTVLAGNVNGFLLALLTGSWIALRRNMPLAAGAAIAVAITVKLTPIWFALWLLVIGQRRAFAAMLGTLTLIGAGSLAGAGISAHVEFLAIARTTAAQGNTPVSLPGILASLGISQDVAAMSIPLAAILGMMLLVAARRNARVSFVVAAVLAAVTSPVVYFHTIAMLAIAGVPYGETACTHHVTGPGRRRELSGPGLGRSVSPPRPRAA